MSSLQPVVVLAVKDDLKALGLRAALQAVESATARSFTLRVECYMESVLSALQEARPDLIVLDLDARSVDAWTFLDTVKSDLGTTAIPVVAFSRDDSPSQAERAYNLGANAFAPRPNTDEQWHEVVRGFQMFWLGPIIRLPKPPEQW
ncbi:response regulator [Deinococcus yavapaiensis]|uniref:Response regulator receiver domain-containing protein n=1 Tax=Deinococcus yavapaiensis KR-236 TaxID=694435 RepID=A0A318S5J6_9DEIO|nr:response regulator [Deinococcus yavapaiensis]PYE49432.1 response regulator receiver domain-containing protein [Deinococcus yavapaiensis KR-236]